MRVYLNLFLAQVPMLASIFVTLIFVSIRIRRYFRCRGFARRHACQPAARANKDPILGLDQMLPMIYDVREHKLLENMSKRYHLYGNTYTTKRMLSPGIFTVEPENIKSILSIDFKDYSLGHRTQHFEPLLGRGIFDTDGDHWAMSRALLRPNFTRDQVADLKSFEDLIPDLFALIPRDGETVVDLQDLFFRYTMDSATAFLFGQSVGSLRMAQSDLSFAPAFNYALEAISMNLILGPLSILNRDRKAEECNRICREFAERFVEDAIDAVRSEKEKSEPKRKSYIFSHELARQTSDKRRILDELMNVLLAGRDTTASLLSNMFFMLAKYPAIWDKLRREVASLEGRLPTYEELRNLKYLRCCMNECKDCHCPSSSSVMVDQLDQHYVCTPSYR